MQKLLNKILTLAVIIPTIGISFLGIATPIASANSVSEQNNSSTVTITKYINGQPATAANASSSSFLFASSWYASNLGGTGSGQFTLNSGNSYSAVTSPMHNGTSNYTVQELNANGGAMATSCTTGGPRYVLSGYTSGNTLAEAAAATPTMTAPNFDPLSHDKYVIVWNRDCNVTQNNNPVQVTIQKYIQGAPANATNASSTTFYMNASWVTTNLGSSSGQFFLSPGGYSAATALMNNGANYSVQETNQNGGAVATSCDSGQRYVLSGYTTGNTLAEAASGTPTMTAPSFTNLTQNKYVIVWNRDCTQNVNPGIVRVNIAKYIQGSRATATSASSTPFLMSATWNASNLGSGTGQYSLESGGATPYQASTVAMNSGASYSTNEIMSNGTNATTTCSSGQRYVLQGYTVGNSWSEAQNATITMNFPSFTNLTQDKYVIVWNRDCTIPTTSKVHILKYVNGMQATASSTNSFLFPMMSTWQASNLNNGSVTSGSFYLGNNYGGASNMYGADTASMDGTYSYTALEQTGTSTGQVLPQGSACVDGKYRLDGYRKSSLSFADAANGSLSTTAPAWTNVTGDQYLIVYNTLCGSQNSTGTPLSVTVTPIKTTGIADNTYENGWKYIFHVNAPVSETFLSMKFSDWVGAVASSTIAAGGNMRISSAQADNGPITITAANTYSSPLHLVSDLSSGTSGRQVDVVLEVKIPFGTVNTSYTSNFGVQTLP